MTAGLPREREPRRIQRKRAKGWRMPDGAVYVGRPTKWGNPYRAAGDSEYQRRAAVALYREYLRSEVRSGFGPDIVGELRGKDLACWCPLVDKNGNRVPCHADVLLELANAPR